VSRWIIAATEPAPTMNLSRAVVWVPKAAVRRSPGMLPQHRSKQTLRKPG